MAERIARRLARAGLCSRREAERWIAAGRVAVDGATVATPATNVDETARVTVDGKALPAPAPTRLWRYHKPRGLITSHRDPRGRATVFERMPAGLPRVVSVGRLDLNAEGLLLLTNDGALARRLTLPANGWRRRYRVRAFGHIGPKALAALGRGLTVEGVAYGAIAAEVERRTASHVWLRMSLTEGKNREIRRVLGHLGLEVGRIIRTHFGPYALGRLRPGEVAEVRGAAAAVENREAHAYRRR